MLTGLVLCALFLTLFIKTSFAAGAGKRRVKAVIEGAEAALAPEAGVTVVVSLDILSMFAWEAIYIGVSTYYAAKR